MLTILLFLADLSSYFDEDCILSHSGSTTLMLRHDAYVCSATFCCLSGLYLSLRCWKKWWEPLAMELQSTIRSPIILSFLVNKKYKKQRQQRDLVLGLPWILKWGGGSSRKNKPFKSPTSRRKFGNNKASVCSWGPRVRRVTFPVTLLKQDNRDNLFNLANIK